MRKSSGAPIVILKDSLQTTPLLTVEETLAALEKARSVKYNPPGS